MKDATAAADHAAMHKVLPPALFAGLLAISADAVIAVDDEQRIIFFNEGAERIFGWTADEVGGQFLEILLPERYRAAHRGHVHGFGAAHGRARLMGERQQLSGLRKSGEEFPCEAAIQRVQVEGHDVFAAVLRDITARQRAEDGLREAVSARDDVLGIVSHDLRNPANAVKMLAQSILHDGRGGAIDDGVIERVKVIQQAAAQIDALIQDLLDATRIDAGRLSVTPRRLDATEVAQRAVDSLRPIAEAGGVMLEMALPEALPAVHADPDRLLQLLSNVVGNAIKFTPPEGVVRIEAHVDGPDVLFVVADTGEGISSDELPHVFERFYQVSGRVGVRHGAGLGLPISRAIVEAHGGQIWIESTRGVGTKVRFSLPVSSPEA